MDLIPADFRQRQWAKRFARSLARSVLFVAVLCALIWLLLNYQILQREKEITGLREQDGSSKRQQDELNQLRQSKQHALQQLSTLDALHGGQRGSELLTALDQSYQEGVWLTRLTLHSNSAAAHSKNDSITPPSVKQPGKSGNPQQPSNQIAEAEGHASDHQKLAVFLSMLSQQPGIKRLTLIDSKSKTLEAVELVYFSISLEFSSVGANP